MAPVRGTQHRAIRTQRGDTILDVALRLFAEKGFDGATITEIEREAGLTPGTGSFYRHFPSKEALFTAVIEREIARSARRHEERAKWPRPALSSRRDGMVLEFHESLQGLARHEALIRILGREGARLGKLRDAIRRTMLDQWAGHEAAVIARREAGAMDQDPEALALVVISALSGYHMAGRFFGAPVKGIGPDRFAAALADLLCASARREADDTRAQEGGRVRADGTGRKSVARALARRPRATPRRRV